MRILGLLFVIFLFYIVLKIVYTFLAVIFEMFGCFTIFLLTAFLCPFIVVILSLI